MSDLLQVVDSDFLKEALDNVSDSIKIINKKMQVVYTNRAGVAVSGKTVEQVVTSGGRCHEEFYHSPQRCAFCVLNQVIKSGQPAFHSFKAGVGELARIKEVSVFPLKGDDGSVEYFIEIVRDVTHITEEITADREFSAIITQDRRMTEIFEMMKSVAPTSSTVLIYGETGAGKELVARAIHDASNRSAQRFVAINCGAMTDSLLETELFGHEKGAFTGAERRRVGKFELADRGTLFLDEIGTISPMMQVKILRALQEGEITRVGGNENIKVDIRVICATNADLAAEVDKGTFREDLYYRINVVPMTLPPLRERPGDIALLAEHYLKQFNGVIGKGLRGFTDEALATMRQYPWPGNVRELRNLIERAVILSKGPMIERIDVPNAAPLPLSIGPTIPINVSVGLKDVVADAEKAYLEKLLSECNGNIGETAERAGVNTRTIHRKMQEFDIRKENFK